MRAANEIPRHLQATIGNELEPGERIRWVGMPRARFFTVAGVFPFLFAIPWTGFALFWICGAAGFRMPSFTRAVDFFPLFGVPFVAVGFFLLATPFWVYRLARNTAYVLTDRRAILFEGGRSRTIRSFRPSELIGIFRREYPDGTGDVLFSQTAASEDKTAEVGFLRIAEPKAVEAMLRELAAAHPSSNEVTP